METKQYLIEELCELTGFSRRTIRYYVQLGLIGPPAGRGRGGFYSEAHLETLMRIKALQEQGLRLDAVSVMLREGGAAPPLEPAASDTRQAPAPQLPREVWVRFPIAPGIEINVSRALEEEERRRIAEVVRAARSIMTKGESHE